MTRLPKNSYVRIGSKFHRLDKPRKWKVSKSGKLLVSMKTLRKQADEAFHAYIRTRDRHLGCITLGKSCGEAWQCGHLFSRRHQATRYHPDYAVGQCANCNGRHRFYPQFMTQAFIERYGQKVYHRGVELTRTIKKFTLEELEEIAERFSNKSLDK